MKGMDGEPGVYGFQGSRIALQGAAESSCGDHLDPAAAEALEAVDKTVGHGTVTFENP